MAGALELVPAREILQSQARAFFAELARRDPDSGAAVPPEAEPDGPSVGPGWGARIDGEFVGGCYANPFESVGPGGRVATPWVGVFPERRRAGIGARLLRRLVEELRETDVADVALGFLADEESAARALAARCGFRPEYVMMEYMRTLEGALPEEPASRFRAATYTGGDAALDEAIAALHGQAYRAHYAMPPLTAELVRVQLEAPGACCLVVHDAGRLVGHAQLADRENDLFIASLVVAESHRGTGAAGALLHAALRMARERGRARVYGKVDERNRASRALAERFGLTGTRRLTCFALDLRVPPA